MRKRIIAVLLAGVLAGFSVMPVLATETDNVEQAAEDTGGEDSDEAAEDTGGEDLDEAAEDVGGEAADGEDADAADGENADGESVDAAVQEIVIPKGNLVDVDVIDLSLHAETTGDSTPVYVYENPFRGQDTSKGAVIEFYADPT